MTRPRISNFPLEKPFVTLPDNTPMQEVVCPLVVNFNTVDAFIIGTATIISRHLFVTAKHVFEEAINILPATAVKDGRIDARLSAVQVTASGEYQLWDLVNCWTLPHSDMAILVSENLPWHSGDAPTIDWKQPIIRSSPPEVGEKIIACGYVQGAVKTRLKEDGGLHHDFNYKPVVSVGIVRENHALFRDQRRLNFPCYQTSARMDGGMSGGPVFDETGALCGLVCSSFDFGSDEGEHVSYACSMWPLFGQIIEAKRKPGSSRVEAFPLMDLAQRKIISVTDLADLQARFPPWPPGEL